MAPGTCELSSISSNPVSSVAQAQLTQGQRAKETESTRNADTEQAERLSAQRSETRESVSDTEQAHGLAVDPDGKGDQENRKRRKHSGQDQASEPSEDAPETPAEARARSAALLADPRSKDTPTPPPLMLDVEA